MRYNILYVLLAKHVLDSAQFFKLPSQKIHIEIDQANNPQRCQNKARFLNLGQSFTDTTLGYM